MRKRTRGWIVAAVAVAVLVPVGIAYAVTTVNGSTVSCLDWAAQKGVSTSSTTWKAVPGMRIADTLAENFQVQVSANLSGAPVQLRVTDTFVGGTFPLRPGATTFSPSSGSHAFSFDWVGTNPAEHGHTFQLQWRVASGTATLDSGAISAVYQGAPTPTSCA